MAAPSKVSPELPPGFEIISRPEIPAGFAVQGQPDIPAGFEVVAPKGKGPQATPDTRGFWESFVANLPHPIDAISEYIQRPELYRAALNVMQSKPGSPEEAQALEHAQSLPYGVPGGIPAPVGSEAALQAIGQAKEGNLAGAAGTMTGAYAATPAIIGATAKLAPKAVRGVKGAVKSFAADEPYVSAEQSLKPRTDINKWRESWQRAQPEIAKVAEAFGKPIQSVDDLVQAIKVAKRNVRSAYDAIAGPNRSDIVDLRPVAKAMTESIPESLWRTNPEAAQAMAKEYSRYNIEVPLETAEQMLKEANVELEGHYAKFAHAKAADLTGIPEIASGVKKAQALRDTIYGHLERSVPDGDARGIARTYGSLMEIEKTAEKRAPVAARQNPRGVGEKFGLVSAVGPAVKAAFARPGLETAGEIISAGARWKAGKWLDEANRSDALIAKSFSDFDPVKHAEVPAPQPPGQDTTLAEDIRYAAKQPKQKAEEIPPKPRTGSAGPTPPKAGVVATVEGPGKLNLLNEVEAARNVDIGNPDAQAAQNLMRLKMMQRGGQPLPPQAAPGGRAATPPRMPPSEVSGTDITPAGTFEEPPVSVRPVPPGVPSPAPGMGPRQGPVPQIPPGQVSGQDITPRGTFEEQTAPRQPRRSVPPRSSVPTRNPGPRQGGPIGSLSPSALQQLLEQLGDYQPMNYA